MKDEAINRTEKGPETRRGPAAHRGTAKPAAFPPQARRPRDPLPARPHPAPAGPAGRDDPATRPRPAVPYGPSPHRPGYPARPRPRPGRPHSVARSFPRRRAGAAGAVQARRHGPTRGLTCGGGGRTRAAGGDRSAAHNEPLQRHGPAPAPPADTIGCRAHVPRAPLASSPVRQVPAGGGAYRAPGGGDRGRGAGAGVGVEGPGNVNTVISPGLREGSVRLGCESGCSVERSPEENVPPMAGRALGAGETRVVPCAREPGSGGRWSTAALGLAAAGSAPGSRASPRLRACVSGSPGTGNLHGHNPRECW